MRVGETSVTAMPMLLVQRSAPRRRLHGGAKTIIRQQDRAGPGSQETHRRGILQWASGVADHARKGRRTRGGATNSRRGP